MPGKEADTPRTGKWGGGFRKGACGGVAGVRRNLPRREPRPGGVPSKPPSRASGISVPAPQTLRSSSHAVPDGHRECPEKRRTPRAPENGAAVSARVPVGVSLEYGETFPGGNPGPAECRRSRPRGLPGYPYRLLKRCGRLHTPSRTGAARFLLAAFFQRRIVSATFNRQEWLWIPTKRPSKARRASIAC